MRELDYDAAADKFSEALEARAAGLAEGGEADVDTAFPMVELYAAYATALVEGARLAAAGDAAGGDAADDERLESAWEILEVARAAVERAL